MHYSAVFCLLKWAVFECVRSGKVNFSGKKKIAERRRQKVRKSAPLGGGRVYGRSDAPRCSFRSKCQVKALLHPIRWGDAPGWRIIAQFFPTDNHFVCMRQRLFFPTDDHFVCMRQRWFFPSDDHFVCYVLHATLARRTYSSDVHWTSSVRLFRFTLAVAMVPIGAIG